MSKIDLLKILSEKALFLNNSGVEINLNKEYIHILENTNNQQNHQNAHTVTAPAIKK